MRRKTFIISIVLVILIICSVILGFYFFNRYKENEKVKNAIVIVDLKKDLSAEFLSEVRVSDFIENINGKIVDDYFIDTTELGEKKVEFQYINEDNIKIKQFYDIEVKDTVAPVVWIGESYTVIKGTEEDFYKKILCGDNYDSSPICEIVGEYDLNIVGTYPVVFKATDNSGNVKEINFNLNVVNPSSGGNDYKEPSWVNFSDVVSKYKNENTEIGIDISEWQDYPDFNKLKAAGVEFAFLRVGGSKLSNGEYFLDKSFLYNIEEAEKAGIPVGIYFYSYADSKERVIQDAEWIYDKIKDKKVDLPIAFDWENWSFYNDFKLSFYELTELSNAYLGFFKDKGYDTLLYSSKSYLEEIWLKQNHNVWLAHYTRDIEKSSYQGEYEYWQLCSDGRVDGIDGDVDINLRIKK